MTRASAETETASAGGTHYRGSPKERRALSAFIKLMRCTHWSSLKAGRRREEAGLTENQFGVMEALFHLGALDQTQLTGKLLTSPSNLTLVIDNLERVGYVQRRLVSDDRRRRTIHLTKRGRSKVEGLLPVHVARIEEVMSGLTGNEQDELSELCRKLGRWAAALD